MILIMIICKQVCLLHCFGFVDFVYNFNVKRCKTIEPVLRFFRFRNNMYNLARLCWIKKKEFNEK